ncbi:class IIb bacteriocin, lactobin A/cerein 7B family [Enterococcus sp. BWB1-3]
MKDLTRNELEAVNGGFLITAAVAATLFTVGFTGGIAVGLNRVNRKK